MTRLLPALLCLALAACAVGPDYARPEAPVPASFKHAGADWQPANPADAAPKGKWWRVFNDPVLDGLMEQVEVSNQTLAAGEARYRQARTAVDGARSQLFPAIGASAGAQRARRGEGRTTSSYEVGLDVRWEADLWGRVRRQVEAARAGEEASAADLANLELSLQAQLATAYFQLRVADVGRELLEDTVKAFEASYKVTQNRYAAGVAARVDVVQAEQQIRSVETQLVDLRATRARLENAIAALVGRPPSAFSLAPVKFSVRIPDIPPGVPSTLLERRPDIAAAERRMAAANARIGVAQAAYFPSLTLAGGAGFASASLGSLASASSSVWSLGLGLAATLIDFGARGAEAERTRAAYDEAVADYRQTVLTAFQEVEDELAAQRWLAEEAKIQEEAARLARESVALTANQYKAGTASYLNVVLVQAAQLNEDRQTLALLGRRLTAAVNLIRALGGAW